MFTMLIRVINNPFNKKLRPAELLPPIPNARHGPVATVVPHCFLQGIEVDPDRFQELLHSMILKHGDGFEPISTEEVFSAII